MTDQFAYPSDREQASADKVSALERLLIEKGVITSATVDKVLAYFRQIREGHNAEDTFAEDMGDTSTAAAVAESAAAPINNPPTNATDAAAAASGEKRPITSTI